MDPRLGMLLLSRSVLSHGSLFELTLRWLGDETHRIRLLVWAMAAHFNRVPETKMYYKKQYFRTMQLVKSSVFRHVSWM